MGWVGSLAKQVARSGSPDGALAAARADVGQTAIGTGIGYSLPAETNEQRLRNAALLGSGTLAAKHLDRALRTETAIPPDAVPQGFAGAQSRTARLDRLEQARAMEGAGEDMRDIWTKTGWYRDRDGEFKYEIDDSVSRWKLETHNRDWFGTLPQVLDHPELFQSYPALEKTPIVVKDLGAVTRDAGGNLTGGRYGSWDPDSGAITLNSRLTAHEKRSVTLHEVDHVLQRTEGFGRGSNQNVADPFYGTKTIQTIDEFIDQTETFLARSPEGSAERAPLEADLVAARADRERLARFAGYQRSSGEVAARNTETRLDFDAEQRRARHPDDTIDVDPSEITVRKTEMQDVARYEVPGSDEYRSAVAKGFDMSQEARQSRARRMGFDTETVWYHGTNANIEEFSRFKGRGNDREIGIHVGTEDQANFMAKSKGGGMRKGTFTGQPNVIPLYARAQNPLRLPDLGNWKPDHLAAALRQEHGIEVTPTGASGEVIGVDVRMAIRDAGYDSIIYKNAYEGNRDADSLILLNTNQLRSVNAAFDPANARSARLVASADDGELADIAQVYELEKYVAYHGTNKVFDEFELDRIGAGEGAQAFGPGLYFTQSRGIAEWYRKRTKLFSPDVKLGDETFNKSNPAHFALSEYWRYRDPLRYKDSFRKSWVPTNSRIHFRAREEAIQHLQFQRENLYRWSKDYEVLADNRLASTDKEVIEKFLDDAIAYLETLDPERAEGIPKLKRQKPNPGQVYTVAVEMPRSRTLLFDEPFGKQAPEVQSAVREAVDAGLFSETTTDAFNTHGDAFRMSVLIKDLGGSDSPQMQALRSAGVRGVKYLDGSSRKAKGGNRTYNFVVFDDDHVSIVGRQSDKVVPLPGGTWPLAVLAGVGAASIMGSGDAEAQEGGAEPQNGQQIIPETIPAAPNAPRGFETGKPNPTYEQFQATTVPGMEAAPEQVSGLETSGQITKPNGDAVWGAAFRLENVVGSMLSKEKTDFGEWEEGFNPLDPEHLEGYEQFADRFIDARTPTRMEQIKRQIDRELRDRDIIHRSGWDGIGAMLVAGTVDPTILIPYGGTAKKGESLLKIGGRFAFAGGAGATTSEIILQNTQELRTDTETALNITGGTLLGGLLGTGGYTVLRSATGKPIYRFSPENEALAKRLDDEMVYDPTGDPIIEPARLDQEAMNAADGTPQSVGAARTDEPDLDEFGLTASLGTADVTAAMKLNPVLRLSTASSAKAREAGALLMENGMFLNRNKDGIASPISVEQAMTEYRGWHAEAQQTAIDALRAHRKAGGKLATTEFYEEVGRAMRRGDEHADEHVARAAAAYRQAVEKTKDRAIELGLLPEDIEVKTAASYFHRMWNRRVLIRKPEDFKRMVSAYLDEQFEKMRVAAAQLEAEWAQKGDFAKKTASDFEEAALSSREAGKASRAAEREAAKLEAQVTRLQARRDALSDELIDLTDGDTPPSQARVDNMAARIRKLDEDVIKAEAALTKAREDLPGVQAKAKDAETYAARMKTARDDARSDTKLADADEKFLADARALFDIERIEGSLQGYRDDAASHVYDTLMGYDSRTLPTGITMAGRGPLKERTFNIPDLFEFDGIRAEDFLVSDAQEVMDRYMRVMSADIELARAFGRPDMEDVFTGIKDEYDGLIKAAKTDKEKKRLRNEMDGRISDLQGVRDVIRGNFGPPTYENMWARGAGVVRSWNYATMLGGMTVSAFPDVANKVLAHGFSGVVRDLFVPLIAGLKNARLAAKEARTLGIAVERTLATRIATLADIGDVYGRATAFERAVGSMTNHFTKWTGMRLWNDVMKQADYIMASNRAIRAMDRPGRMGKATRVWLAQLGIDETQFGAIMGQVRKYGQTSGAMRLANPEQWDDQVAKRIWIGAMGKNANTQTVTPGAGDRLLMMHTELGKTIGQFKTFAMGANQRVTVRAAQQARMGHGRVISALATYISMGMLVYYLKQIGSNRTPSDDPAVWVREGIDRSGVVSVFMEGFNTAEKVTGQTFVGDSPSSRYASRTAFGSLLGPSFGRGQAVTEAISNLLDGELQDRDIHAVRKLLPYNNIFWLRTIFDEFEIATAEASDAEETSLSDRRESLIN